MNFETRVSADSTVSLPALPTHEPFFLESIVVSQDGTSRDGGLLQSLPGVIFPEWITFDPRGRLLRSLRGVSQDGSDGLLQSPGPHKAILGRRLASVTEDGTNSSEFS